MADAGYKGRQHFDYWHKRLGGCSGGGVLVANVSGWQRDCRSGEIDRRKTIRGTSRIQASGLPGADGSHSRMQSGDVAVGGIGVTLMERTVLDRRDGGPLIARMADYLVPV
jgi:hypothetical protein